MFFKKENSQGEKAKEDQIKKLEEEIFILKGIQDAMPDPYFVRDMDYNIIVWPKAIENLMGYTEEEAKNIKCGDLFKATVCKDCPTQKCIFSKDFLKDASVDVYTKDGEVLNALVSNAGVYDKEGNPLGAVEIVKDNTRYQRMIGVIGDSTQHLSAISEEMAASSQEVSDMSEKLKNQTIEVSEVANQVSLATEEVSSNSDQCVEYANGVKQNIDKVNKSMDYSTDRINNLEEKSKSIENAITAIQNIASQTNLLSLNASIEAARAGETGRGFAVVANEIKDLAEDSDNFSKEIEITIQEINHMIKEVIEAIETVNDDFRESETSTNKMIDLINEISRISDSMVESMKRIENSTANNLDISSKQNDSMEELEKVAQNVAEIAQITQVEFDKIKHESMG